MSKLNKVIVRALGVVIILVLVLAVVLYFISTPQTGNVSIGPGQIELTYFHIFTLTSAQVTGSLTISGGSGNDINFWVTNPQGTTILNDGRVSQGTSFEFTAQSSGAYTLHFDNSFSTVSTKTVSYTLHISLPTLFGIPLWVVLIYIAVILILIIVVVALAVALSHKKRTSRTNQTPPTTSTTNSFS